MMRRSGIVFVVVWMIVLIPMAKGNQIQFLNQKVFKLIFGDGLPLTFHLYLRGFSA